MSDVDLQVAVMVGDRGAVKRYIKAGGDLEVKDDEGATPLCHAAFWTHVDVAKDLIDAGADVNVQRRNDGFTPLHVAAKNNQPRMIDLLVGATADLNVQEDFGDTPLHWAYRSKATECIKILLAAGADPEMCNHEGRTPKECQGTGVDRQDEDGDEEFEGRSARTPARSDTPSAGDASTVVGGGETRKDFYEKSPSRPIAGRSSAAGVSPRTTRNRSGSGSEPEDPRRAQFRVAYPPTIQAGGKWHGITAYLFEPSASRAVCQADRARVSGSRQSFTADDTVEDGDRTIPPGTDVTVRPTFPRICCVNPVSATVRWVKDVHTLSFEVRPPASASSGTVTGSVDFYVGPILVAQAWVKMAVVTSNESTEEQDILGPVAKVFDTAYVCYAAPDEALLLPYLERFKRLGIANLTWRPASGAEKEAKDLIREASVFQICWSAAAQLCGRVKTELKYAGSVAKSGSLVVRGICWDPATDDTSVKTDHGSVFPLRLHNSFLLEEPCTLLAGVSVGSGTTSAQKVTRGSQPRPASPVEVDASTVTADHDVEGDGDGGNADRGSAEAGGGCITGGTHVLPEKLATPAVEHTRGHISRLRAMVGDASTVDVPRIVWLYPADGVKGAHVNLETDAWLTKPVRVSFLCPVSMKPSKCGADGKGYLMTLPRGWGSKIGIALKIGVAITAAATDAGELTDLPVPGCQGSESSAEWQGQVVNAAYDGLTGAVASKANESIDTAFFEADAEGTSTSPSTQLCTEVKQSYANLRTLLQKGDKGLHLTGLVKATHGSTTEWVHPAVADLFRNKGLAIFEKGALKAADKLAASAATRSSSARGTKPGHHAGGRGARSTSKDEVIGTLRLLEEQILAMGESAPASA